MSAGQLLKCKCPFLHTLDPFSFTAEKLSEVSSRRQGEAELCPSFDFRFQPLRFPLRAAGKRVEPVAWSLCLFSSLEIGGWVV